MSNRFLALSTQDRKLAFDNAALTLHLNAVILEKDFWVSSRPIGIYESKRGSK